MKEAAFQHTQPSSRVATRPNSPAIWPDPGDNFFAELTIPPWDYKLLFQPGGDVSIYELSGFEFSVETNTTFVNDPVGSNLGSLSVTGNATSRDFVHTFTESVSVSNDATSWTAETNFFPLRPGLVGFDTVHLADGVRPFSETTGEISLLGSPTALLSAPFSTSFSVDFAFTERVSRTR